MNPSSLGQLLNLEVFERTSRPAYPLGEMLEIQFKSESGYFVSARFVPRKDYVVLKDEWGRELKLRPTRGNLKQVKGWSESRE